MLTPAARLGLALLQGVEISASVEDPAYGWLVERRIDALLASNPLQPLYDRVWACQREALAEAVAGLEGSGIEALVFKGADVHMRCFGDRALGGLADVDVLVRGDAVEAAREVLLALGYRHGRFDPGTRRMEWIGLDRAQALERGHHELVPLMRVEPVEVTPDEAALFSRWRPRVPIWRDAATWSVWIAVDVHHGVAVNVPGERFFDAATPARVGRCMAPADLLSLTASRYYVEVATTAKRSLRDLAYLVALGGCAPDWDRVMAANEELGLGASLFYPLAFLQQGLGVEVPSSVLHACSPRRTTRMLDWGWQLGKLFDFVEPFPIGGERTWGR
jgi:hypothetical protein